MAQRGTTAKIDLVELEKLCQMQATDEEIAAFFNVSSRTITRRKKSKRFARIMERGRAKGRLSVRRAQLKMLEAGNPAMGIWLGKQILGQSEYGNQAFAVHTLAVVMSPKCEGVYSPETAAIEVHAEPASANSAVHALSAVMSSKSSRLAPELLQPSRTLAIDVRPEPVEGEE